MANLRRALEDFRCQADKARMEKLRERKARKAARLAERRQRDAERRLFRNKRHQETQV